MIIFYAIILAVVQGITEFLPISSSGHLVILHDYLQMGSIDSLTFDVALHVGTALALIIYFYKDIKKYFKAFLRMFRCFNIGQEEQKTVLNLIIATIPAALVGFFLESIIEGYFRNSLVVAINLIVVGILFFIVEKYSKKKIHYEGLSLVESFIIGCSQCLALIPGVSRSGITIITGMSLNMKRDEAARFSFLLGIPIILGAGVKKIIDFDFSQITVQESYLLIIGIVVSLLTGYFVVKFLLNFLQKRSLNIFGWYRIILGILLLILLFYK